MLRIYIFHIKYEIKQKMACLINLIFLLTNISLFIIFTYSWDLKNKTISKNTPSLQINEPEGGIYAVDFNFFNEYLLLSSN